MDEYLLQIEAGQTPNQQEILENYPDLADELGSCLQGIDFIRQIHLDCMAITVRVSHAIAKLHPVIASTMIQIELHTLIFIALRLTFHNPWF